MRKLSKEEMQAVSGGGDNVCLNYGYVYGSYQCTQWGPPPPWQPPSCPTKQVWISTGYNTGYWATVCAN